MTVYFGDNKRLSVRIGNKKCTVIVGTDIPVSVLTRLLSADSYILADKNGNYLIPREV
jgi:hypothetical protein